MKKRNLFFISLLILPLIKLFAQECVPYFPMREGAQLEIQNFDGKDRLLGSQIVKVVKKTEQGVDITVNVESESFDSKGISQGKSKYDVVCQNGEFLLDMKSQMGSMGNQFKGMKMNIKADKLGIPKNPTSGQNLSDGQMTINIENPAMPMKINVKITNRKVDAFEKITTPAGTFDCVKIKADMDTKMMIDMQTKTIQWYSKDVGLVRSESYDGNGKLASYTILKGIK